MKNNFAASEINHKCILSIGMKKCGNCSTCDYVQEGKDLRSTQTDSVATINFNGPGYKVSDMSVVNLLSWVGHGDHSKTFLPLELFCWRTPSWLKVMGWWGGGPCDYYLSAQSKDLGLWILQTWSGLRV